MKVIVLAGGSDQIALIKELKKNKTNVVLVDYYENPPAKDYVDKHIKESTLDVDEVIKIAIKENAQLVTTACTDQALLSVARVSEALSLPCYISYQTALNVTNKAYMKKILSENQISTSKYKVVDNADTTQFRDFSFPIVVKPADCNSSTGVTKVHNVFELSIALTDALAFSRTKNAIIEEFKEGIEISADFYIENNEVKLLSVTSSNKIEGTNNFTIIQSCFPAVDSEKEAMILQIGRQIAKAFGLNNTPLLVQLIEKDGYFNVLELSARMGGGSKYKLIEVLSGVKIMKVYVDLIMGKIPNINPQKKVNFALMNYIYCYPGIFSNFKGLDELRQNKVIDEYFLYKSKGMKILKSETSSDRIAGFLLTSKEKSLIIDKLHLCDQTIKILDENGKDIMIHSLYPY